MRVRRGVGVAALVAACLIPLVGVTSVAMSDRGLGGSISDRVDELVSETDTAPDQGAARLTAASSTRGKYWREAGRVYSDRPLTGVGAGAFEVARLRHRTDAAVTRHAHGYPVQTLADLGLVGLGLSVALLIAWLVSAARTTGLYPRRLRRGRDGSPDPRREWDAERAAFTALALMALVFGMQSAIDWTWFVPGPAAMALVAAGYVAGRGPVAAVGGPEPAASPGGTGAPDSWLGPALVAAAAMLVSVLVAWAIWQPETLTALGGPRPRPRGRRRLSGCRARHRRRSAGRPALPGAAAGARRRAVGGRPTGRPSARSSSRWSASPAIPTHGPVWPASSWPTSTVRAPRSARFRASSTWTPTRPMARQLYISSQSALRASWRARAERRGSPAARRARPGGQALLQRGARAPSELAAGAARGRRPCCADRARPRATAPSSGARPSSLAQQRERMRQRGRRSAGHVVCAAGHGPRSPRARWPPPRRRRR